MSSITGVKREQSIGQCQSVESPTKDLNLIPVNRGCIKAKLAAIINLIISVAQLTLMLV